ncbi:MAG: DUF3793 family protein [Eubacteriales bacterium]|nr:DUF3793 family protein [Eubacteriales bacterium]
MSQYDFEKMLATHCAPTLMGVKPANLISFKKSSSTNLLNFMERYEDLFLKFNIKMRVVCSCKNHFLIFVYRQDLLNQQLSKQEVRQYLMNQGYPKDFTLEEALDLMSERYKDQKCPNEIGVFLGYPLEDVIGFEKHKGSECKYSGLWKVYGDVQVAKEMTKKFLYCRDLLCNKLETGLHMEQLLNYQFV